VTGSPDAGAAREPGDSPSGEWSEDLAFLRERLSRSERPVLVCSTSVADPATIDAVADAALRLLEAGKRPGLFFVLPGPNSSGASWLSGDAGPSFEDTLEAMENGSLQALVVAECDLFREAPDRARLDRALQKLRLLLVLDYLPTETAWRSHAFVPTTTVFEADAAFASQEGRIQRALAVHEVGLPIWQETGRSHPVREFRAEVPGGDPVPAWSFLLDLRAALSPGEAEALGPWEILEAELPGIAECLPKDPDGHGWRWAAQSFEGISPTSGGQPSRAQARRTPVPDAHELLLLLVDQTFGTEELSGYSPFLRKVEPRPLLEMHAADAAAMGCSDGDLVEIATGDGPVTVALRVSSRMARGVLLLPRHMQIDWHKLKGSPRLLRRTDLRKAC
jgi:NADH-quinone oxidoreductase subunit G